MHDDDQEEIIQLATNHLLTRLDEEARGPDVLDLSDLDADSVARIRAAIEEWRADPTRCLAMTVLHGDMADRVSRVLSAMDAVPDASALVLSGDAYARLVAGERLGLKDLEAPAVDSMWRVAGLFESQGEADELTFELFASSYECLEAASVFAAARLWAETQDPMCYEWGDAVHVLVAPDDGGDIVRFALRMTGRAELDEGAKAVKVGTFEVEEEP